MCSPEGGSIMTLQPGMFPAMRQVQSHRWPLRPGVQVHINGSRSLMTPTDSGVLTDSITNSKHIQRQLVQQLNPDSLLQQPNNIQEINEVNDADSQDTSKISRNHVVTECMPYYESLRDEKELSDHRQFDGDNENSSRKSGSRKDASSFSRSHTSNHFTDDTKPKCVEECKNTSCKWAGNI